MFKLQCRATQSLTALFPQVLSRRESARREGRVTEGVTPTVSLAAALLIFLGVGVFAVLIAQAFQMVRT